MNIQFNNWQAINLPALQAASDSGANEALSLFYSFDPINAIPDILTNTRITGTWNGMQFDLNGNHLIDNSNFYTFTSLRLTSAATNLYFIGNETYNLVSGQYTGYFNNITYSSTNTNTNFQLTGTMNLDAAGNLANSTFTEQTVTWAGNTTSLKGNFTTNASGAFTSGVITSIKLTDSVGHNFESTNLSLSAPSIDSLTNSRIYTDLNALYNFVLSATNLSGNDVITGDAANNIIYGEAGDDSLVGGFGNDSLYGGLGNDTLNGGDGDDTYGINVVTDVIQDISGIDTVNINFTSGGNYTILGSIENAILLTGNYVINVSGNTLNNTITGNTANNYIYGDAGDDSLVGGAGNDSLYGGLGNDTFNGGDGDDTYGINVATDVILADTSGIDTVLVNFASGSYTLTADLENITLNPYAINLNATGNVSDNTILGNIGNNTLDGGDGSDTIKADAGDDVLIGGAGNDSLYGGLGNDTFNGGDGNDTYGINVVTDVILADTSGIDTVLVNFASGSYTLAADLENITLNPYAINLNATGNASNNIIIGNSGINLLNGAGGVDLLTGGAGADVFRVVTEADSALGAADTITDFSQAQLDKIGLAAMDANTTLANDQAFNFIGNNVAFSNFAGQLRFDSTTSSVYGDTNGDSVADFQIILTGISAMQASDFYL